MKTEILLGCAIAAVTMMTGCKIKPGYSGEDLNGKVEITREAGSTQAELRVDTGDKKWNVYSGPSAEKSGNELLMSGEGDGNFSLPVDPLVRTYFYFATDNATAILAERRLPLEGGFNFRDLGGYRTTDGKYVKWGKIFRSDDLANLTGNDLAYLRSIPVNTVVDFRSPQEIGQAPDKLPSESTKRYELSISPGDLSQASQIDGLNATQLEGFMMQMNEQMVSDPQYVAQYREFFRLLQDEANAPLLFHCSAGKDRTGMGAALVLFALGVSEETVMEDYLLSNRYIIDKYASYIEQYPALSSLFGVKREFLQSGIDRIKRDHGTVENFLRRELNVDIEKLRQLYLY